MLSKFVLYDQIIDGEGEGWAQDDFEMYQCGGMCIDRGQPIAPAMGHVRYRYVSRSPLHGGLCPKI